MDDITNDFSDIIKNEYRNICYKCLANDYLFSIFGDDVYFVLCEECFFNYKCRGFYDNFR